jgi:DNA-binding IscR family transcriptional regulator
MYKIPVKPNIQIKEKRPDARRYCILPIRACLDKQLSLGDFRTLALLASYSSSNGFSFVALSTMANARGVTVQAMSQAVKRLVNQGYVEIVRKGFTGLRGALRRIIFDANITAVDAMIISNNNEVFNEGYIMRSKQTKQTVKTNTKANGLNHSLISFDDAMLVVQHSLKTDSDLLTLERLVYQGITLDQLKAAYNIV